jgi:hypothetical protein
MKDIEKNKNMIFRNKLSMEFVPESQTESNEEEDEYTIDRYVNLSLIIIK